MGEVSRVGRGEEGRCLSWPIRWPAAVSGVPEVASKCGWMD